MITAPAAAMVTRIRRMTGGRHAAGIAAALLVPAVALVTAACGGGQAPAKLPPVSARASSPAPAPATATADPQQAVISSYTAYLSQSKKAEAAAPATARDLLEPYAAQPYLNSVLSQMASYRAQDEVAYGYVIPHITKVTITGSVAQVYDCQDASHAALARSGTGTVIPGTTGKANTYLIASLTHSGDRWRLTSLAHVSVPCQPAPTSAS